VTRRIAAADALAALCTLLLAVLLFCQAAVDAAGEVELDAGGTSREADSIPESPGEPEPPRSPGPPEPPDSLGPPGEANSPNEHGLRGSHADSSQDDPDPLDKPPPYRNGGRPNSLLTAHAPPTGDRPPSARPVRATPPSPGCSTDSWCPGHKPGPPGQQPAARPAVLQVFRL
jgi:hypothetical protein